VFHVAKSLDLLIIYATYLSSGKSSEKMELSALKTTLLAA